MAHAPGWIELYGFLEQGGEPPPALVEQCRNNRNGIGETMLHWYAIEGEAFVLQKLVDLGFDVDTFDAGGSRPIIHAAMIGRWDNVRVLRRAGAATRGIDRCGMSYRATVSEAGDAVPEDLRADAYQPADLLDPDGPEDAPILELRICRAGATGASLTTAEWHHYLAAHPEVDGEWFRFEEGGARDGQSCVVVMIPSLEQRRQVHAIALHFGARVEWMFEIDG